MRTFCPNCQSHQDVFVLMYSADQSWMVCRRCRGVRVTGSFQTFVGGPGTGSKKLKGKS
jgi:ribosomal protein L44E